MNKHISIESIIESIEKLSKEDQNLLFEQLKARKLEKQHEENGNLIATIREPLESANATCEIRNADATDFWGEHGQGTYHILIQHEAEGAISAVLLGFPECKAFGATRQQAISNLHDLVNAKLAEAEIIPVTIKSTKSSNPWIRLAGKYQDDPDYDNVLAYIQEYRHELDAESDTK